MKCAAHLIYATFACFCIFLPAIAADERRQPNVVFILADDLGWSDTTLYGTTQLYKTPHIEKLAARGMTFSRAYSASPLCSPTRASILTGLSPARTGLTAPNCHLPEVVLTATASNSGSASIKATLPKTVTRLRTEYYTLAEALKDNGYVTAHFGKWHLGSEPYSPLQHGFDIDVPHWSGPGPAGSYVAPWKFPDFDPNTPNEHIEDRMAKEAEAFMESHRDEPFFLNYWMFSVHAPFDAKPALIEKYQSAVDKDSPQRSPTYAAMVESMDEAVGKLLATLDRLKLSQNTIIIFASDNGGNMYNEVDGTTATSNKPLRGGKATMYEGGVRGPCIVVAPNVAEPGARSEQVIQSCDFYPTLLDLLSLQPQVDQQFDGVSIVPALQGRTLSRNAIFTYFPHNPKVPDWLPPAVSVHRGDWKLIRLFHGGENGAHRWKLFNLASDIGETSDLATSQPDRVEELDRLIEEFLVATSAVRPLPNPDFDSTKYRIEDEGVGQLKKEKAKPPASAGEEQSLAGWQAGGTCQLQTKDQALEIVSSGGDPHVTHLLPNAATAGTYLATITYSSKAAGSGQLFWQERGVKPRFSRDRSETFGVEHDGQLHEYQVRFHAKQPVAALRLDPATSAGSIQLVGVTLENAQGETLFAWPVPR